MAQETFVLDSSWQFKEFPESARRMRDLDAGDWLPAEVPSSIFTCLSQNGIISEQELISNPDALSWISEKSWVFRKAFDVPPALFDNEHIEIVFDGLDTVAHLWLNEKLIGKSDNMFIPHRFDVKPYLKNTNNQLYVKLVSPIHHTDRLLDRYGKLGDYHRWDPRSSYIRKAAYQFGSDFGPALPGCGIVRPVRIEGSTGAKIENLHLRTIDCSQHDADIRIALELKRINGYNGPLTCKITLTGGGLNLEQEVALSGNDTTVSAILHIDRPFLWWPQGYGIPHLYHVKVDLLKPDGQLLDSISQNFGIRTLRVTKLAENTQLFVNEQPINLKCADWMPLSMLPGTHSRQAYEDILQDIKACHINMLRVWGGGYYENPDFYELCDRMGILVWQTFIFDSAYYPDRQWFLDAVQIEAKTIIKQLRNHACLAVWCGNNEIDRLHKSGRLGKGRKFYGKPIFHTLLPQRVHELDPDREYIPTTVDIDSEDKPLLHLTPPIPSPPCFNSLASLDSSYHSFSILDRICGGYSVLQKIAQCQLTEFFPPQSLPEYIRQSQVVQARRIQGVVEDIRAIDPSGGNCGLGAFRDFALYISASMVDAKNQPKALYYYAKRFLAPVLVTLHPEDETGLLGAYAVNDTASPVTGMLCCKVMDIAGSVLDGTEMPLRISPFSRTGKINLPKSLSNLEDPSRTFLYVCIRSSDAVLAENTFFFRAAKEFKWPVADIDVQVDPDPEKPAWNVTLTSEVVVRDLQITPPQPARLSDNFLTLLPNHPKTVRILFPKSAPPIRTPLELFSTNQTCGTNW